MFTKAQKFAPVNIQIKINQNYENAFLKNRNVYEINIQLICVAIPPSPDLVVFTFLSVHQSLLFSHLS